MPLGENHMRNHRTNPTLVVRAGAILAASLLSLTLTPANAQTLQTLQILKGASNGGQPWAAPVSDAAGNFYGTTSVGGDGVCYSGEWKTGCGAVYELSPPASGNRWTDTLIYQFRDLEDGYYPESGLVFDTAGNLYGATEGGGNQPYHCGTVFELSPPPSGSGSWTKSTLYSFNCDANGGHPEAGVVFDKIGNLYGTTTLDGGAGNGDCSASYGGCGVIFELSPPSRVGANWSETVLYDFQGGTDGSYPASALVFDGNGNLYGVTPAGGSENCGYDTGCGTVFELSPPSSHGGPWTESILHSFSSDPDDGYLPRSGMVFGNSGDLYGVTEAGGPNNYGTVFQLAPPVAPGGTWTETVIFGFGPTDGAGEGPFGTPAVGSNGTIYGTTEFGGTLEEGSAFQLAPPAAPGGPWVETTLTTFTNHAYPLAGLTLGHDGWLYGGTLGALGSRDCATGVHGQIIDCGELFRILPQ